MHACAATDPPSVIFMGRDKYENEELITHGWDEDVWFHVDKLSSAHVYLRMPTGMKWDDIPEPLLQDLGQLTKANSIEGEYPSLSQQKKTTKKKKTKKNKKKQQQKTTTTTKLMLYTLYTGSRFTE